MTISPLLRLIVGGGLLLIIAIGAIAKLTETPGPVPQAASTPAAAVDHYVLALGWSPSYAPKRARMPTSAQCGAGKRFGFILRGLWPQTMTGR